MSKPPASPGDRDTKKKSALPRMQATSSTQAMPTHRSSAWQGRGLRDVRVHGQENAWLCAGRGINFPRQGWELGEVGGARIGGRARGHARGPCLHPPAPGPPAPSRNRLGATRTCTGLAAKMVKHDEHRADDRGRGHDISGQQPASGPAIHAIVAERVVVNLVPAPTPANKR